jgi:hypothetical protein
MVLHLVANLVHDWVFVSEMLNAQSLVYHWVVYLDPVTGHVTEHNLDYRLAF